MRRRDRYIVSAILICLVIFLVQLGPDPTSSTYPRRWGWKSFAGFVVMIVVIISLVIWEQRQPPEGK